MSGVSLKGLRKSYGAIEVIFGATLDIVPGEFVVFVGPSGCGKSTLLRMIAGLEDISAGELSIGGRAMNDVAARDRGVAMVFQNYALYPHMTVRENMGFGLRNLGVAKDEIIRSVESAAATLQLTDYLERKPRQLSGGQRQRVAIGRAIVREPQVFLFDEPLSNLDAALRVQMRTELSQLHARLGATMIYVTHDQTEALTMADRIVVLREGRIEQIGAPLELYDTPENLFVAGFIGAPKMNFLTGHVDSVENSAIVVCTTAGDRISATALAGKLRTGDPVTLGIRPENLTISPDGPISATVSLIEQLGSVVLLYATTQEGIQIVSESRDRAVPAIGETVRFSADGALHVFNGEGRAVGAGLSGKENAA
ncbi:sn-glycerol-3-phosphate ABC transporter ATP-binding protein UgpC [uncultured Martelella sp.]|uniref:ABC transporter ATP-binding protein n=1 Tax=uncultured Martelella sp. TaxID=392331 RepID=UPI0029C88588|nr:sn-glycerol-3-phosphate ABC transporter ATP-binding protein UgpC [uncultured Martelella sp.]